MRRRKRVLLGPQIDWFFDVSQCEKLISRNFCVKGVTVKLWISKLCLRNVFESYKRGTGVKICQFFPFDFAKKSIPQITVKKFHDFSITQILREIKIGESWYSKSAVLTHLVTLNFDFYEFLHFLKVEIYHTNQFQSP